jgi:hypothetical protein
LKLWPSIPKSYYDYLYVHAPVVIGLFTVQLWL